MCLVSVWRGIASARLQKVRATTVGAVRAKLRIIQIDTAYLGVIVVSVMDMAQNQG